MYSPRLSWDVLGSVVDHSSGRPNTLCSLALACRHLRRPSHLVMFCRVQLESHDHVFAFLAFFQANPELQLFAHTIIATSAAFGPSPLYVLPNLSSIECVDESQLGEPEDEDREDEYTGDKAEDDELPPIPDYMRPQAGVRVWAQRSLVLHNASLTCFTQFGARIRTLRLSSVFFLTLLSFA
ncbi:hypothetical protein GSI_09878 [Ganoderma sinense ZZ0214-1]|uniref:F-box domain-containing protein n=1 Tax=Ganoderma sinense ZZ0214-1 TaxID=1077348 RepID=A0A2G8S2R1_9APHY|nr:hypothetical protein GSI_09878 [Ganoderma sinense ZZ0214-1]